MVRSLHRAWSRCKAGASSGRTTRKEISTPLGRVSVWSLFMPIILYLWCLYCLRRGVLGTSGVGVSRKFARTRNGARRWRRRGPERKSPGPRRFPLKGLWLGVLGPYLAVDLLDEGLAILILLLVLADLLELLDRKAVELLHDVVYTQVLVVRGLQGTEDGGLKLRLPGGSSVRPRTFSVCSVASSATLSPCSVACSPCRATCWVASSPCWVARWKVLMPLCT